MKPAVLRSAHRLAVLLTLTEWTRSHRSRPTVHKASEEEERRGEEYYSDHTRFHCGTFGRIPHCDIDMGGLFE